MATSDALMLIERFGENAYGEARRRVIESRQDRIVDGNRPGGHWNRVRLIVGRKTRRDGLDTATRYLT